MCYYCTIVVVFITTFISCCSALLVFTLQTHFTLFCIIKLNIFIFLNTFEESNYAATIIIVLIILAFTRSLVLLQHYYLHVFTLQTQFPLLCIIKLNIKQKIHLKNLIMLRLYELE